MERTEVLVVGAGPVGMALAVALSQARLPVPPRRCARPRRGRPGPARASPCPTARARSSTRLGVWGRFPTTSIETIHVSHRGGFGRTLIRASDYGLPALGYVADAAAISAALQQTLAELGVSAATIPAWPMSPQPTTTSWSAPRARPGRRRCGPSWSPMRKARWRGKEDSGRDYGQQAIITSVRSAAPQGGVAYERFTKDGPLALLPYGDGYAWSTPRPRRTRGGSPRWKMALSWKHSRTSSASRLQFVSATPRAAFPLALKVRAEPVGPRCVWLGNAAQTLHPVAGQGFNLALRDVWGLAEALTRRQTRPTRARWRYLRATAPRGSWTGAPRLPSPTA